MDKQQLTQLFEEKFDHIYLQHYPKYTERFDNIINELKRVGIYDAKNFSIYYSIPTEIDELIYNNLKENNQLCDNVKSLNIFRQGYTHYKILHEAVELEYKHILIIHDDIKFLNDLNLIYNILSNLPDNYNVCLFDYLNCSLNDQDVDINDSVDSHFNNICPYYYQSVILLSNTICAYDYDYMKVLIKAFNYKFGLPDTYISLLESDFNILYYNLGINIYNYSIIFSYPRIAIQYQYNTSLVNELWNTQMDNQYEQHPIEYLNKGIDYSQYNY